MKQNCIYNWQTYSAALVGLIVNFWSAGWHGLLWSAGGLAVGFGLLFVFYLLGGFGAGDVKFLAAIGALIMPWVQISNLASHVLALNIIRLSADWQWHFNYRPLLLETFVDSRYFTGTCYKAANWLHIGHTHGSTKQGQGYRYHGYSKQIYIYVVEPDFRRIIDCQQKPAPLFDRPPQTQTKVEELVMLLEHCKWHPQLERGHKK